MRCGASHSVSTSQSIEMDVLVNSNLTWRRFGHYGGTVNMHRSLMLFGDSNKVMKMRVQNKDVEVPCNKRLKLTSCRMVQTSMLQTHLVNVKCIGCGNMEYSSFISGNNLSKLFQTVVMLSRRQYQCQVYRGFFHLYSFDL